MHFKVKTYLTKLTVWGFLIDLVKDRVGTDLSFTFLDVTGTMVQKEKLLLTYINKRLHGTRPIFFLA